MTRDGTPSLANVGAAARRAFGRRAVGAVESYREFNECTRSDEWVTEAKSKQFSTVLVRTIGRSIRESRRMAIAACWLREQGGAL